MFMLSDDQNYGKVSRLTKIYLAKAPSILRDWRGALLVFKIAKKATIKSRLEKC